MKFELLKSKYLGLNSQFLLADAAGKVLYADNEMLSVRPGQPLEAVHWALESSWHQMMELAVGQEIFLPCISALINENKAYLDIVVKCVEEEQQRLYAITLIDLTEQYGQVQAVVQEKNQSNILNELLRSKNRAEALEKELLNQQKNELERIQDLKNEFLATMTHEIRTPLNAILGLTHILLSEEPRQDQAETLEIIRFSGENLLGLISDILDFSKIEANKIELENTAFDLQKLCHSLIEGARVKANEKSIFCEVEAEGMPDYVLGDPVRLSQVVNNLLANAIKFTETGGVRLVVKGASGATPGTCELHFQVIDTGIGIPLHRQQDVFEKFTQAEVSTTRKYGGTGLGLAITKRLLELMGSQISLVSAPGEGSTFSFKVTLQVAEAPANADHKQRKQDIQELGLKVLVVEDNTVNQLVARKILEKWGVQVVLANDGFQAIERIKGEDFDLVLMDLLMPGLDGYQTTEKIRAELGKTDLPIIALTASSTSSVRVATQKAGMNGFVSKPFKPESLQAALLEHAPRRN